MFRRVGRPLCGLLAVAWLTGCGGKTDTRTATVSGTVTLDGKPLPEGVVYFKIVQTGAVEALPVRDGRFEGKATPGDYRVEVNAYQVSVKDFDGMKGEVKENLIPPKYNVESTLTASVPAGGTNALKFDVQSK